MIAYIRYSWRKGGGRRRGGDDSPANSVASQKEEISRWLEHRDMPQVSEGDHFIDELTSGRKIPFYERAAGKQVLERINRGEKQVICTRIDRIFRSIEDGLGTLKHWRKRHVELILCDGVQIDLSTVSGWQCCVILLMGSEFFPLYVAESTSRGMKSQQRDGLRMGSKVQYGYMQDPDDPRRVVENEEEQHAISVMRELASKGVSCSRICRLLTESGLKPRGQK